MITTTLKGRLIFNKDKISTSDSQILGEFHVNSRLKLICAIPVIELAELESGDFVKATGYIKVEGFGDENSNLYSYFRILAMFPMTEVNEEEELSNKFIIDGSIARNQRLSIKQHMGIVTLSFIVYYRDNDKIPMPLHCRADEALARILSKIKNSVSVMVEGELESELGPILLKVDKILEVDRKPYVSFETLNPALITKTGELEQIS